jgi:hypothetical protein
VSLVAEFLHSLPAVERNFLVAALGDGLERARLAAVCVVAPEPSAESVVQLLEHLTLAIQQLERAREVVQRQG